MNYFKFRLLVKRHIGLILIGIYAITFCYLLSVTKPNGVINYSEKKFPRVNSSEVALAVTSDSSINQIAVLVLVCDRYSVTRTLDQLLNYRPDSKSFPIIVSHDCGENGKQLNSEIREKYGKKFTYLSHPNYETTLANLTDVPSHMKGYYLISAHYGWALNYTFKKLGFQNVIVLEDDLDIAPDFFEYFKATLPLLYEDSSLWCVSAYNDIGMPELIDPKASELLYRTDFFPGLGWMLTNELWNELSGKWPNAFWDDWMRLPEQRKDRACVHPEISRTKTYGKRGVSQGQFFDKYLATIKLNDAFFSFSSHDLSFLKKTSYDNIFFSLVNSSFPVKSMKHLEVSIAVESSNNAVKSYRLSYRSQLEYMKLANDLGIINDFKSGVPRGGYNGVVPLVYKNHRLYLVSSYDDKWKF